METAISICADRRLIALGSDEGALKIVDADTGAVVSERVLANERVMQASFSGDGNRLGVGTSLGPDHRRHKFTSSTSRNRVGGAVSIYEHCRRLHSLTRRNNDHHPIRRVLAHVSRREVTHTNVVDGVGIDRGVPPNGRTIAGIRWRERLVLWRPSTQSFLDLVTPSSRLAGGLALSSDGKTLAANSGSNVLHLWELPTGQERPAWPDAHESPVTCMLITGDSKTLITAGDDRTVRRWQLATGRQIQVLLDDEPSAISLSHDGRWLAAAPKFHPSVRVWDATKEDVPVTLSDDAADEDRPSMPIAMRVSEKEQEILVFHGDGVLRLWSLKENRLVASTFSTKDQPPFQPRAASGSRKCC